MRRPLHESCSWPPQNVVAVTWGLRRGPYMSCSPSDLLDAPPSARAVETSNPSLRRESQGVQAADSSSDYQIEGCLSCTILEAICHAANGKLVPTPLQSRAHDPPVRATGPLHVASPTRSRRAAGHDGWQSRTCKKKKKKKKSDLFRTVFLPECVPGSTRSSGQLTVREIDDRLDPAGAVHRWPA